MMALGARRLMASTPGARERQAAMVIAKRAAVAGDDGPHARGSRRAREEMAIVLARVVQVTMAISA